MSTSGTRSDVKEEPVLCEVPWTIGAGSRSPRSETAMSPADEEALFREPTACTNCDECRTESNMETGMELGHWAHFAPLSFLPVGGSDGHWGEQEARYDWLWTQWMSGNRGTKRRREYAVTGGPAVKKRRLMGGEGRVRSGHYVRNERGRGRRRERSRERGGGEALPDSRELVHYPDDI